LRQPLVPLALAALFSVGGVSTLARSLPAQRSDPVHSPTEMRPLYTGLDAPEEFSRREMQRIAFKRARDAGVTYVRILVNWAEVAPPSEELLGSNPEDPANAGYDWSSVDRQVRLARMNRLTPILTIVGAPAWARGDKRSDGAPFKPDPARLGRFALAAALRYSGRDWPHPRVKYWEVWNEPNISLFLRPQFENGRPLSPELYREMVNRVAASVKHVHADNIVIAGATAPFRDITQEVMEVNKRWGPLTFMRELLCVSRSLRPTCRKRTRFDVWSHHPYTSGGPSHSAVLPDDVSLGDLPKMRRVLDAAAAAGHIVSDRPVEFWITEFGWDSNPPDPEGVPMGLLRRWVSEALYRAWESRIEVVVWYHLRDEPKNRFVQSGLYYRGETIQKDRAKAIVSAFRFPLVAYPMRNGVYLWARTPGGERGRIVIEQLLNHAWRRVSITQTDRYGIIRETLSIPGSGFVRGRFIGEGGTSFSGAVSAPFSLRSVPDRPFNPFGLPYPLEPSRSKK
jgi:hypothetical protein